jgi:O-antigen ligase
MAGMEIFGWASCTLAFAYALTDIMSPNKEFHFFLIGPDFPLWGLLIIVAIGLQLNAPEADFLKFFGQLRWVLMLYLLTYCLDLFPGINKFFKIFMVLGTLIAGYGIFQHFTGIDLRHTLLHRPESAVTVAPFGDGALFQAVGLFSHHLTYGYSFSMLICFPFAALLLSKERSWLFKVATLISTVTIGLSLLWTYGRGVWIATFVAMAFVTLYVNKRILMGFLLSAALVGGGLYTFHPDIQGRFNSLFDSQYHSNSDRRDLWKANFAMFQDHPWIGIGYAQNEIRTAEYYKKLNHNAQFVGHAHNSYINWLSTTGLLGLTCYTLFILSFLMMSHRLWGEVPESHFWHRAIVLGALGAQISMHVGGMTQWNFGDAEVNHLFIFCLAVVAYLSNRYSRGIVPDDHAL